MKQEAFSARFLYWVYFIRWKFAGRKYFFLLINNQQIYPFIREVWVLSNANAQNRFLTKDNRKGKEGFSSYLMIIFIWSSILYKMSKGFFPKSKIFKLKSDLALEGPHYTSGQHSTTRSLLATTESSHGIKVHEKQVNCAFQNLYWKGLGYCNNYNRRQASLSERVEVQLILLFI